MFALIETELMPKMDMRRRLLAFLRRESGVCYEEERRWGTKVLRVTVTDTPEESESRRRLRMELALQGIAGRGLRVVVTPRDFLYTAYLDKWGLTPAAPAALYRRMAVRLAELALTSLGTPLSKTGLTLCARRVTPELMRIAEALVLRVGKLGFRVPGDFSEAARGFHAAYGLSLLGDTADLAAQSVYLVLDTPADPLPVKENSLVLWLDGTTGTSLPGRHCNGAKLRTAAKIEPAPDVPQETLLAVLLSCGAIAAHQISVACLTWNGKPLIF